MSDDTQQRHALLTELHRGSNASVSILVHRIKTLLVMKERHQLKVSQLSLISCYVLIEDRCAICLSLSLSLWERIQSMTFLVAEIIHVKGILAKDLITLCSDIAALSTGSSTGN